MTPDPLASFPAVSTRSIAFQGMRLTEHVNGHCEGACRPACRSKNRAPGSLKHGGYARTPHDETSTYEDGSPRP
jgi:hypothetical protein